MMKTKAPLKPKKRNRSSAASKRLPHWVHLIAQDGYDTFAIAAKIKAVMDRESVSVAGKSVFLKVSFVFPVRDPERVKHIITNPAFIAGVAQALVERGASVVYIGDAETFATARYSFDIVDMQKALKALPESIRKNVVCCYLDEVYKEWITPDDPFCPEIRLDYPKIVRDVDVYISLPKLKVNIFADITLSVKNGMGLITKETRLRYHNENLHAMIADIFQVRPPDYVITDAVFAGEAQGPMEATPYPMNLILFGNNGPSVDTVCCNLMGYDPREVKHLMLLHERGFGPIDLKTVRVENAKLLNERRHVFTRPSMELAHLSSNITCHQGECCASGCLPFVRALLDGYGLNRGWESLGEYTIIMGKNLDIPEATLKKLKKRKTLVYGDCVERYRKYGVFYRGCPPDYINALITFPIRTSLGRTPWLGYVEYWTRIKTDLLHLLSKLRGKKYRTLRGRVKK